MSLVTALLRATVGGLFVGHGTQKLFGWFGGHGLDGTAGFFESIGLKPGKRHATTAGVAEAAGGALIATGFLTPLGATLVTSSMVQAIRTVHLDKGPWVTEGGWEYPAVIIASVLAIAENGPGPISLDRLLGTEHKGTLWALAALGAGVAGPLVLVKQEQSPAAQTPAEAVAAPEAGAAQPAAG